MAFSVLSAVLRVLPEYSRLKAAFPIEVRMCVRMSRVTFLIGFALLCAFALPLAGCSGDKQQQASQQQQAAEVSFITITTRRVELKTTLTGRTSAFEVAEVRPQVSGIIQKRLFTEGQEVAEGQQLYQIDPAVYQAALSEARAALLRAEANAKVARLTADRHADAVKINAVSKQEYDTATAAYQQARAEVIAAQAAVDTASINMRYTKVNAPIAGHIGISSVTPGALVTANQAQPLALVQQLDAMYVDVTQPSAEVLRFKRALMEGRLVSAGDGGAVVNLMLEDGSMYDIPGTLQLSDISVDTGTGAVTVRAKFDNPLREITPGRKERILFPGMFVRAVLQEAVNENAILIPQAAVGRDTMGRATVYTLGDDGTVGVEVITYDRTMGNEYLVSSGLKVGQKVIVDGRIKVRPGAKAKGIPYVPAAGAAKTAPADGAPAAR